MTTPTEQHSPLPWHTDTGEALGIEHFIIRDENSSSAWVASISPVESKTAQDEANAALICHRVNTHEALVAALEKALGVCEEASRGALDESDAQETANERKALIQTHRRYHAVVDQARAALQSARSKTDGKEGV